VDAKGKSEDGDDQDHYLVLNFEFGCFRNWDGYANGTCLYLCKVVPRLGFPKFSLFHAICQSHLNSGVYGLTFTSPLQNSLDTVNIIRFRCIYILNPAEPLNSPTKPALQYKLSQYSIRFVDHNATLRYTMPEQTSRLKTYGRGVVI
jgi:hypothetical protein